MLQVNIQHSCRKQSKHIGKYLHHSVEKNENMSYNKLCSLFITLVKMFGENYTKMEFINHRNKSLIYIKYKLVKEQTFKDLKQNVLIISVKQLRLRQFTEFLITETHTDSSNSNSFKNLCINLRKITSFYFIFIFEMNVIKLMITILKCYQQNRN